MMRLLKRQVGNFAVRASLRSLNRKTSKAAALRAAIIPPATPGSVGDAAMMSAAAAALRQRGFERVDIFYDQEWPLDSRIDRFIPSSAFFYGDSSKQRAALLRGLVGYTHVFFVGADVLDGAYSPGSVCRRISLVGDASASGRTGVIFGASFNESPDLGTRTALAALPASATVCARDPQSRERMLDVLRRPIRQTADLAFLLEPAPEHPDAVQALDFIKERRRAGDRVIALNVNYLQVAKMPDLIVAYREIAAHWMRSAVSLLLVPHDSRTDTPDAYHLRSIVEGWTPALLARTHMIETESPGAMKAALASVDFLCTGRLHAMILAMGSGTPAMGVVYQNKFEGMLQLFHLSANDFTTSPECLVRDATGFADRVLDLLARASELRTLVTSRVPAVRRLAENNFL